MTDFTDTESTCSDIDSTDADQRLNTIFGDISEEQKQECIDQLNLLRQSRIQDINQALDSCINASAITRKAFADILKLGNQVDIEYYKRLTNSIEIIDCLINYLPELILTEQGRTIL